MSKPTGYVVYEGPSNFNQAPIVAVVTLASRNEKTGNIPQLWILDANTAPHDAVKSGADVSVCGSCPHAGGNGCYVLVQNAPLAVWKAWKAGKYPAKVPALQLARWRKQTIRLGAYGDPAMIPDPVLQAFAALFAALLGYTHQWRETWCTASNLLMASADSTADAIEAQAIGYRTFRVSTTTDHHVNEVICPSTTIGLTCDECKHCNGRSGNRKSSVVVQMHGSKKSKLQLGE